MQKGRVRTSIEAEFQVGGQRAKGRIMNVGEGGLFVGTGSLPGEGESAHLHFTAPDGRELRLSGLVWWTTEGSGVHGRASGFGLRLIEETPSFREFWASLQ
jgi:hypothetical protein